MTKATSEFYVRQLFCLVKFHMRSLECKWRENFLIRLWHIDVSAIGKWFSRAWLYHAVWDSDVRCRAMIESLTVLPHFYDRKIHAHPLKRHIYDWAKSNWPLYRISFQLYQVNQRPVSIRGEGNCDVKYFERAHNCHFDCFIGAAAVQKIMTKKKTIA